MPRRVVSASDRYQDGFANVGGAAKTRPFEASRVHRARTGDRARDLGVVLGSGDDRRSHWRTVRQRLVSRDGRRVAFVARPGRSVDIPRRRLSASGGSEFRRPCAVQSFPAWLSNCSRDYVHLYGRH